MPWILRVLVNKGERAYGWKSIWISDSLNYPKLAKGINLQIPEAEQVPDKEKINPKKLKPRHIMIKWLETEEKEKNMETETTYGEKQFTEQWISHWKLWR